jgi:hypothetical protein
MTARRAQFRLWAILSLLVLIGMACGGDGPEGAAADLQTQLAEALGPVDETYAELAADTATQVEIYPAPFLTRYEIYRVEHRNPSKPIVFYVGYAPGEQAYVLTGTPAELIDLVRVDGVRIDSPDAAEAYAVTFLETTRSMSELFYVIESTDDVQFRPNLSPDQEQAKAAFVEEYGPVIEPANAAPVDDGYLVTVYAVRDQALERHAVSVGPDGAVTDEATTLERDLPLVYGL